MTSSNDDVIKAILQYQARLERYSANKSEDKMLYVLGKLSKLQIRTSHLETTGVGRTVNALRKLDGAVGDAAKDLVALWKDMVLEEEKATQETSLENEDDADSVYSSENENKDCKEDSSKENISHSENDESEGYISKPEVPKKSNDFDKSSHKYHNGDSRRNNHNSNSSSSSSSSSSSDSEEEIPRKQEKHHSRKRSHSSNSSSDDKEMHHSKKSKKHSNVSCKDNHKYKSIEHKHEKKDKHSSSKHKESSEKHKESSEIHKKSSDKRRESSERSERHKSNKNSENESKHKSKKEIDEEKKHKNKKDSESLRSSHKTEKNKKHDQKESGSQSNHKSEKYKKQNEKTDKDVKSSHSSKHKEKDFSHSSSDKNNSKERDRKEKHETKKEEKHSETKLKDGIKEAKKTNSSKSKDSQSTSSSKHKSNSSDGHDKKKIKLDKASNIRKEKIVHGIDSESGASFAEALGMCGPLTSSPKKKSSSDKHKPSQSSSKSLDDVETESSKTRKSTHDESSSSKLVVPELLKEEPPEPLNICLSSLLPEITPNYKPLGISFDSQPKRLYTDDEALSRVMTNKNQRTKVYSGNKTVGKVESLFQLCVRILQDNIDALEYTGGVPYLILKPIMERATPDQLFNLEHHNPYLIEDTDELWQLHCQKDFRTKQREEMESWRDMYMRCLDEREAKLNAVKANIKLSQDKSIPVRTTKLAYVDSEFVKPPRNVARKQVKNGTVTTDRKITTGQKLTALAQSGEASKISVPDPGRKAADRSGSSGSVSSSASMKPKKAPLMAKTLSFLKNRFRR